MPTFNAMTTDEERWEQHYQNTKPENLPWNAGGPDSDLVRLVTSGRIPVGQALDVGTGPGHDAVFLISRGFDVIAIDISQAAVVLARENASQAGLFGFFSKGDIRKISVEDGWVDFVHDRGCFHTLSEEDRPKAVAEIHRVLRRGGKFLLKVFSDKEPPGEGPHRFTRKELEEVFQPAFRILEIIDGIFEGPRKPHAYSVLMESK